MGVARQADYLCLDACYERPLGGSDLNGLMTVGMDDENVDGGQHARLR